MRRLWCLPALSLLAVTACTTHRRAAAMADYGILPCPAVANGQLLSTDALQCWFDAAHGRWRTVSHESHYAVLVVNVEASDLSDADEIARQFVNGEHAAFTEILVYVKREQTGAGGSMRRVRWTPDGGFESFDFDATAR